MIPRTLAPLLLVVSSAPQPAAQRLSTLERRLGWSAPFAANSLEAWQLWADGTVPSQGWSVEDGVLRLEPGCGDLVSRERFENLELEFGWSVAPGANSGVKVRVRGEDRPLGPEYQVLDDAGHPETGPLHAAAALYGLEPAEGKQLAPTGAWNRARIVARGPRLEHWVNGRRVVELDQNSDGWAERIAASKFQGIEAFGRGAGRLLFQDHGGPVAYRDVRVRAWDRMPGEAISLLQGDTLDGWKELGDARYSPKDGVILGQVDGGAQSFLATERSFGDFIFEVDVKTWSKGNSGIQIRSHQTEDGRLRGYQVEIDPSKRGWSGGLYDEYRRGWLDDSSDNAPARAALRIDAWNRYRIEAVGPWIRTWINGVPVTDWFDVADLEGVIGLQVHSGTDTRVEWRNPRIIDLGRHVWSEFGMDAPAGHWELDAEASDGDLQVVDDQLEITGRVVVRTSVAQEDFTLRLFAQGAGSHIALRHGGASFEHWTTAGSQELTLCRYADRTVFLVNARVSSDVHGAVAETGPIEIRLRTGARPLRLTRLETLVAR